METLVVKKNMSKDISDILDGYAELELKEKCAVVNFLTMLLLKETKTSMIAGCSGGDWTVVAGGKTAKLLKILAEKNEDEFLENLENLIKTGE